VEILKKIGGLIGKLFSGGDIHIENKDNMKQVIRNNKKTINKPKIKNKGEIGNINVGNTININNGEK